MQLSFQSHQEKKKTLYLSASARADANGDLCMNHILAPLIDSFVYVRLLSMLFISVATSEESGSDKPLKVLEDWSNSIAHDHQQMAENVDGVVVVHKMVDTGVVDAFEDQELNVGDLRVTGSL
ncbi:hypothetical protein L1887_38777 [Cichorium endivia]|nr:hypothetical protein L1887_38777 [Cichorium endivia]